MELKESQSPYKFEDDQRLFMLHSPFSPEFRMNVTQQGDLHKSIENTRKQLEETDRQVALFLGLLVEEETAGNVEILAIVPPGADPQKIALEAFRRWLDASSGVTAYRLPDQSTVLLELRQPLLELFGGDPAAAHYGLGMRLMTNLAAKLAEDNGGPRGEVVTGPIAGGMIPGRAIRLKLHRESEEEAENKDVDN